MVSSPKGEVWLDQRMEVKGRTESWEEEGGRGRRRGWLLTVQVSVLEGGCAPVSWLPWVEMGADQNCISFCFFGSACSVQKFPGQRSKLSHSSGNAESLTARPSGNSSCGFRVLLTSLQNCGHHTLGCSFYFGTLMAIRKWPCVVWDICLLKRCTRWFWFCPLGPRREIMIPLSCVDNSTDGWAPASCGRERAPKTWLFCAGTSAPSMSMMRFPTTLSCHLPLKERCQDSACY